jgi:hypothetical protein
MQALEKRIAALELKRSKLVPLTIVRTFVVPGQDRCEIEHLSDTKGTVWHRLPGESEQGMFDRASLECYRNAGGTASLTATGAVRLLRF